MSCACARDHEVGTTALLLALVGEALHRINPAATTASGRLRAMVPRTTRALRRASTNNSPYRGNHTAALAVDLPVGPMPLAWRLGAVAVTLARQERADQPVAAETVVRALGHLPAPLHARLVRAIYRRRFFTLITSVLPGSRKAHHVGGIRTCRYFRCYLLPRASGSMLGS